MAALQPMEVDLTVYPHTRPSTASVESTYNVVLDPEGKPRYLTVHECIGRILEELPAIGRDQENKAQKFKFRGIDDVLNALNPLLGKYGVFFAPAVLERIATTRTTNAGGVMYEVNLLVQYTFYGPAGDWFRTIGCGEGTDSGDKATNKAMTGAMKYVLFQVFAIATAEASENDGDRHSPENTVDPVQARKAAWGDKPLPEGWTSFEAMDAAHQELLATIKAQSEERQEFLKGERESNELGWPMKLADFTVFKDLATPPAPEAT